jgi:hypothetical protein
MADDEMPLREAVEQYKAVVGHASTLGTYREHAASMGKVLLGVWTPAHKDARGRWVVQRADLTRGLQAERKVQKRRAQNGADYARHVLHGRDGERVLTDGHFSYEPHGAFHILYDHREPPWQGSGRSWVCNTCWTRAAEEHDYDYCLRCDDLQSCGVHVGCTLSAVRCDNCGMRQVIPFDTSVGRAVGTAPHWPR